MTNIGTRIAERRKELQMTQEELATRMGYKSRSTINKIELGVNDIPQSKIAKFAEVLRTTPSYLMGWQEMHKKNDTISDVVIRMRTDEVFRDVVNILYNLDEEKLSSAKQFLTTFLK